MVTSLNLPVSRKRLEKYRNTHRRQIEHAAKQWEARQSKVQNNLLRKEWPESQTAHKYHTEYDKIRGWMFHHRPPYVVLSKSRTEKRSCVDSWGRVYPDSFCFRRRPMERSGSHMGPQMEQIMTYLMLHQENDEFFETIHV